MLSFCYVFVTECSINNVTYCEGDVVSNTTCKTWSVACLQLLLYIYSSDFMQAVQLYSVGQWCFIASTNGPTYFEA